MGKEETASDIIERLRKKYSGDDEAMEVVERAAENVAYIEKKEKEGNYDGQPALGCASEAERLLDYWY